MLFSSYDHSGYSSEQRSLFRTESLVEKRQHFATPHQTHCTNKRDGFRQRLQTIRCIGMNNETRCNQSGNRSSCQHLCAPKITIDDHCSARHLTHESPAREAKFLHKTKQVFLNSRRTNAAATMILNMHQTLVSLQSWTTCVSLKSNHLRPIEPQMRMKSMLTALGSSF